MISKIIEPVEILKEPTEIEKLHSEINELTIMLGDMMMGGSL